MSADNVRVVVRIRPMNAKEIARGTEVCVTYPGDNSVTVAGKTFTFDSVIPPKTSQSEVYNIIAKPIVTDVLKGFNGTIFAYGQTSSGKTFTMEGVASDPQLKGLIPRIVDGIFDFIEETENDVEFQIKISYYEIYMEKILDLFDPTKDNLSVTEDKNKRPFVRDGTERNVATPDEIMEYMTQGRHLRHVTETKMNAVSSRSHSLFLITIKQDNEDTGENLEGKLFLVDLAGSEKVGKTGVEGQVLEEAKNINKSLSALGNVINALVERAPHIPYRDSKLTRILQESLGGNAKTTMVVCCSPSSYNEFETKSTLMFGMRTKTIKNKVQVNIALTADEWRKRYEIVLEKNEKLKHFIESMFEELTKWRKNEKVPENQQITEEQIKNVFSGSHHVHHNLSSAVNIGHTTPSVSKKVSAEIVATSSVPSKSDMGKEGMEEIYKQMDEKDNEINKLSQQIKKLEAEMSHLNTKNATLSKESTNGNKKMQTVMAELNTSQAEVKEVLTALEELAVSFEIKSKDYVQKVAENDKLIEDIMKMKSLKDQAEADCDINNNKLSTIRKDFISLTSDIVNELSDLGQTLNVHVGKAPTLAANASCEDQLALMRLSVNKIKSDAKTLKRKSKEIEEIKNKLTEEAKTFEHTVETLKGDYNKSEAKLKTVTERLNELETKKSSLEKQLADSVGADQALKTLQEESGIKQRELNKLKGHTNTLMVENNSMKDKYDKFIIKEGEYLKKIEMFEQSSARREETKLELKSLEENVIRELQTLHTIRKLFVSDLKAKIKQASSKGTVQQIIAVDDDADNENIGGSVLQREKIAFLENNLENLTKNQKLLVRDNSELSCAIPKMEKHLKAVMERCKLLEVALKESKEANLRDRKQYQNEVDRIKEVVRQKTFGRANITRPIKGGQKITTGEVPPVH